jgi:predicted lysophospholipase L1 biosynthesis ABC-type transport system permease subunit
LPKSIFPSRTFLGKRFHFIDGNPKPTWWTIVGVVADVRHSSLEEKPQLQAYLPFWQSSSTSVSVVLRTSAGPALLASAVRGKVNTIDPAMAVADIRTMDQLVSEATAERRFQTLLLSVFSGAALVLSLVGLYALLAYSVRQRTAELGIRVALGAHPRDILGLILGQGTKLTLVGVGIGVITALALTRLMSSPLFGVSPIDPLTFASVAALLTFVALLASYFPAHRAMRVDPMVALRYE